MESPRVPVGFVVFDLDGTLVDSRRDIANTTNVLLEELGGRRLTEQVVATMVGEGAVVLVRRALAAASLDPDTPGALERFLALYDERLLEHTRAYDGIEQVIAALSGRLPIAVLTNKPLRASAKILEGLGLKDHFTCIAGGDTAVRRKPDPAGLLDLASRVGVAPASTMLVGDSIIDLQTARNAGAQPCVARYGFGFVPPGPELCAGEHTIDHPLDLLQIL